MPSMLLSSTGVIAHEAGHGAFSGESVLGQICVTPFPNILSLGWLHRVQDSQRYRWMDLPLHLDGSLPLVCFHCLAFLF